MSAAQPNPASEPRASKAAPALQRVKADPTMDNVVETLGALHEDNQRMEGILVELKTDVATLKTDVATLKTDVGTLKTDVGKLLDHFGLVSGETP